MGWLDVLKSSIRYFLSGIGSYPIFRIARYPIIFKTEPGRVGYPKKMLGSGWVTGSCWALLSRKSKLENLAMLEIVRCSARKRGLESLNRLDKARCTARKEV